MLDTTSTATTQKRRWYQYSLRTLLIVVTLLAIPCGYVGWQARAVAHRKAMLQKIIESGGIVLPCEPISNYPPHPNFVRRWFGDVLVKGIGSGECAQPYAIKEVEDAFPEARVSAAPP